MVLYPNNYPLALDRYSKKQSAVQIFLFFQYQADES